MYTSYSIMLGNGWKREEGKILKNIASENDLLILLSRSANLNTGLVYTQKAYKKNDLMIFRVPFSQPVTLSQSSVPAV